MSLSGTYQPFTGTPTQEWKRIWIPAQRIGLHALGKLHTQQYLLTKELSSSWKVCHWASDARGLNHWIGHTWFHVHVESEPSVVSHSCRRQMASYRSIQKYYLQDEHLFSIFSAVYQFASSLINQNRSRRRRGDGRENQWRMAENERWELMGNIKKRLPKETSNKNDRIKVLGKGKHGQGKGKQGKSQKTIKKK